MNNLGEILHEARKAKGLSLRDAADATKIRSDFLANMEEGAFDFDLPEIYKRGFLRLYADYLGLDKNQIMADYNAFSSVNKAEPKQSQAKNQFLSRLTTESEESGTRPTYSDLPNSDFSNAPANPLDGGGDKHPTPYLKIGAILAALVALVAIIIFAVTSISSGNSDAPAANNGTPEFTIKITALRDTVFTLTPAKDETKVLFSGEIRANAVKTFTSTETLALRPRDKKDLKVERNGIAVDIANAPTAVKYNLQPPRTAGNQ